jgi:hypothetical protein
MNGNALIRLLSRTLTLVMLGVSGAYLLVYLYRWEWNRALISGLFFLAAEVAFVGSSVRADIRALAARYESSEAQAERRLHAELGVADARPARPFAWLDDAVSNGTNVFVPVLLGAGVILSAAAFVVERVAGVVAHATVDRSAARRLAQLETPANGLLEKHDERPQPNGGPSRQRVGKASRAVAMTMLAVLVVAAVDLLADATQTRPAPLIGGTTVVELDVAQHRAARPVVDAAEALVVACHGSLPRGGAVTRVTRIDGDTVELEVSARLGEPRRRRFFGCLEDATLDLVSADVVRWVSAAAT